jgi:hypothetical protein
VILSTLAIIGVIMLAWVFLPDVDLSDIKETTSSIRDVAPNIPIGVIMTICVILVLILAGMGAVGKGDFVGKWAFRSLGLLLLAVVFGLILVGPGFIEAWSKFQEENAAALKGERRSSSETKGVPPISAREYFGHPVTINPKGEWSQWIQVTGDRCIWIYSVTPDQVRAKAKQADSGLEWNKYHELRQRGVHGDPGWVQIKSDVEVTYEFRPRGMC